MLSPGRGRGVELDATLLVTSLARLLKRASVNALLVLTGADGHRIDLDNVGKEPLNPMAGVYALAPDSFTITRST
jgi:hypothetical protein